MNELIKVNMTAEKCTVSGRELHEFLEVSTEYAKWMTRMIEYGHAMVADLLHRNVGGLCSLRDQIKEGSSEQGD